MTLPAKSDSALVLEDGGALVGTEDGTIQRLALEGDATTVLSPVPGPVAGCPTGFSDVGTIAAFASYHVTANQLLAQNTDPESIGLNRTLLARPFEAHIGLWMVRFEGNDRWQIQGIDSNWSAIGTPVEELEHPWD
ncbi:MAG: hypothetical protein LOY01_11635 [Brachybacterium paraconglomeratum]|nr:hypothetical protein [Brachybacterium paraconglomeratum]